MVQDGWDRLARAVADDGISRRRALRTFAAGAVTVALPWSATSRASARTLRGATCDEYCKSGGGCPTSSCPDCTACCCVQRTANTIQVGGCFNPNTHYCKDTGTGVLPVCLHKCKPDCCPKQRPRCCGNHCCRRDQSCCGSRCCDADERCGAAIGTDGNVRCCPVKRRFDQNGRHVCCPQGTLARRGGCCDVDDEGDCCVGRKPKGTRKICIDGELIQID